MAHRREFTYVILILLLIQFSSSNASAADNKGFKTNRHHFKYKITKSPEIGDVFFYYKWPLHVGEMFEFVYNGNLKDTQTFEESKLEFYYYANHSRLKLDINQPNTGHTFLIFLDYIVLRSFAQLGLDTSTTLFNVNKETSYQGYHQILKYGKNTGVLRYYLHEVINIGVSALEFKIQNEVFGINIWYFILAGILILSISSIIVVRKIVKKKHYTDST